MIEVLECAEDEELLIAHVRVSRARRGWYGRCQRRWRARDLGAVQTVLEAHVPGVVCSERGVVVAAVPLARHGAGRTRAFDDQVTWLAVQHSKTAVTELTLVA